MAKTDTFHCRVVTPERIVVECDAKFAAVPAHDGEIGFLRHRAPLLCKLDVGALRIHRDDDSWLVYYVDGGFAEMAGDELTVLTEDAKLPQSLDPGDAEESLSAALHMPMVGEAAFDERQRAVRRARVQKALARSHS